MDPPVTENLFLLEFLVDSVQIDPCFDIGGTNTMCVAVQFLDNAALDICEDDFCPKRQYSQESECIKSGKSCLFSLTPIQAQEASSQFDLTVHIYKRAPPNCPFDKIPIGSSIISLAQLFKQVKCAQCQASKSKSNTAPTVQTLRDRYEIKNQQQQVIGQLSIYIRMSCFGKIIVTQFQMNLEDKTVLFKDEERNSMFKYKKVDPNKGGQGGPASGSAGYLSRGGCGGCGS